MASVIRLTKENISNFQSDVLHEELIINILIDVNCEYIDKICDLLEKKNSYFCFHSISFLTKLFITQIFNESYEYTIKNLLQKKSTNNYKTNFISIFETSKLFLKSPIENFDNINIDDIIDIEDTDNNDNVLKLIEKQYESCDANGLLNDETSMVYKNLIKTFSEVNKNISKVDQLINEESSFDSEETSSDNEIDIVSFSVKPKHEEQTEDENKDNSEEESENFIITKKARRNI